MRRPLPEAIPAQVLVEEAVTKKAKDMGFDSWVSLLRTATAGR
jgi:hypothetical protein